MAEDRIIKYINRDFDSLKRSLEEFAKNYFPNTYTDFSETSPGTMFMEMAAYVGDVLSFYTDNQLQETFRQYAKDPTNLFSLAYTLGYRPKVTTPSEVEIEIIQKVDATGGTFTPDWDQALLIQPNAQLQSATNPTVNFTIPSPVDFSFSSSYDPTEITISAVDGGNPSEYTLKKKVKAFSGETKTKVFSINGVEKFKTLTLEDIEDPIIGVQSIVDADGNVWYEVPYLGQETVYTDNPNGSSDAGRVPYLLSLTKVPRRFVTRFQSSGALLIQFGSGIAGTNDSEFLPNPNNVGLGTAQDASYSGSLSRLDYAYDPANFLFSQTYGLAPTSDLTVTYLVGGGVSANVPANSITAQVSIETSAVDTSKSNTLTFNNLKPAVGGKEGDTVEELRQNIGRAFGEQSRTVTLEDYAVRSLSLPSRFGIVAKVYPVKDYQVGTKNENLDPLEISLYTLSFDADKRLITTPSSLKENLKKYLSQYILLTDSVNIKDAFIINIGIKYDILITPGEVGRQVLTRCNTVLQDYFNIDKRSINQSINLSKLYTLLDKVKGVQTVQKVEITNLVGGNYSEYEYDIKNATKNNIVYPSYDPMIFEVKHPLTDIKGRIITL